MSIGETLNLNFITFATVFSPHFKIVTKTYVMYTEPLK